MHISVVGSGYVGLVTGVCFAEFGVDVTCVDNDAGKIEGLTRGKIPIYEPGLEELVERNLKAGRLHFTTDLKAGVEKALVVFIAVGTPPRADGSPDLSFIYQVAESIADPSRRNSGFETTENLCPPGFLRRISSICAPVPVGTVDFVTTTL